MTAPTCSTCDRIVDPGVDGDPPLAWSSDRTDTGAVRWLCPPCTRRFVRSIEAKLDHEWF